MNVSRKKIRTCKNGHDFYKVTECPSCPICEKERRSNDNFLSLIGAPARRALEFKGITSLEKLSTFTENDILNLHGMGKSTIPKLHNELKKVGLFFKK